MQNIFITGNLAADCEIVKGKDDAEFVRFNVAVKTFSLPGISPQTARLSKERTMPSSSASTWP